MKILQINTVVNSGSTGRIAEGIGISIVQNGWESYIAFGRERQTFSMSKSIKIGNSIEFIMHALKTRLFDLHGFGSKRSTLKFIKIIDELNFDLIHFHNLHGYYLNIEYLFSYLNKKNIPIVCTLHDCWSFTGHCTHFTFVNCQKWKSQCFSCPEIKEYPASFFLDNSEFNFRRKKELFNSIKSLTIVPVSKWLENEVKQSFLNINTIKRINNGIDLNQFDRSRVTSFKYIKEEFKNKKIILGVSTKWTERKGLKDFFKLQKIISNDYKIVLIGLSNKQLKNLPLEIHGIERTENIEELVEWYVISEVLFNPTLEDTYPTINLESISCGTPVITYNTGGSPESISNGTGFVVKQGDLMSVLKALNSIASIDKEELYLKCRTYALNNFDKNKNFENYIKLYKDLIKKNESKHCNSHI